MHAVNRIHGGSPAEPGWPASAGLVRGLLPRCQVQMFWLAVLGAKVEVGCGLVPGPVWAVLP